jgi:hypothetical protein
VIGAIADHIAGESKGGDLNRNINRQFIDSGRSGCLPIANCSLLANIDADELHIVSFLGVSLRSRERVGEREDFVMGFAIGA